MRATRWLIGALGVAAGLWGLWSVRDFTSEQLISTGLYVAGGIVVHDFVLAPLTVLVGVVAVRLLPRTYRLVAGLGFLVWATLTVTFVPVLSGQGGKPDNDTILNRPYVVSWLVLTGVILGVTVVAGFARSRRRSTSPGAGAHSA